MRARFPQRRGEGGRGHEFHGMKGAASEAVVLICPTCVKITRPGTISSFLLLSLQPGWSPLHHFIQDSVSNGSSHICSSPPLSPKVPCLQGPTERLITLPLFPAGHVLPGAMQQPPGSTLPPSRAHPGQNPHVGFLRAPREPGSPYIQLMSDFSMQQVGAHSSGSTE